MPTKRKEVERLLIDGHRGLRPHLEANHPGKFLRRGFGKLEASKESVIAGNRDQCLCRNRYLQTVQFASKPVVRKEVTSGELARQGEDLTDRHPTPIEFRGDSGHLIVVPFQGEQIWHRTVTPVASHPASPNRREHSGV